MPTYQFEAMDATGQEIKDVIDAPNEEEAQATIRQMGYFVTKISIKKSRKAAAEKKKSGSKAPALQTQLSTGLTISQLKDLSRAILRYFKGARGKLRNSSRLLATVSPWEPLPS